MKIKRQLIAIIWKIKRWSRGVRNEVEMAIQKDIENFIVQ